MPGLLELARPVDVGLFVEASLELDHHRDLLAVERRVDEVLNHTGLCRSAVQRHFDRANLRVLAGLAQEPLHRGAERFVRVVKQQGFVVADGMENVALPHEARGIYRPVVGVAMLRQVEPRQLEQGAEPQEAVDLEDVRLFVEAQLGRQPSSMGRVHPASHLETNDRRELALAQLRLDQCEQVVRFVFVALDVRIAGHAEQLGAVDGHAGKQQVEVVRHDLFERHERQRITNPDETRHAGAQRHLHPRHQGRRVIRIVKRHQQVERQVRHEWETGAPGPSPAE